MKFNLIESKIKDYSPRNLKRDTCYAVAYSICADISYEDALKKIPDGKFSTLKSILLVKEHIPITYVNNGMTANQFASKYPMGTYLLLTNEHAMACVDGVLYDTQGFENKPIISFYTFKKQSSNNETAFVDAVNNDDNKYVDYAIDYLKNNFIQNIINKYGDTLITSFIKGHTGFNLRFNGKTIEFNFPFLTTDKEVIKIIEDTINENMRG